MTPVSPTGVAPAEPGTAVVGVVAAGTVVGVTAVAGGEMAVALVKVRPQ